ncbi:hypothetical protein ACIPRD_07050 [Streptomyces sp. NPDC090108]|uniref:hypothetical protein n=1 Tax=Streptomyces sp. NPDC090108 TaxID=3365947 RepID=UPI00381AC123
MDAEAQRRRGRHVCVVDADGFSALLRGRPAPCLELRRARTGRVRPVAAASPEARVLGGPREDIFVAEVKSLTGAREDQQMRLGIGQILDYAHQLRSTCPSAAIRPVLVLEKCPSAVHWTALADSVGLRLTWAPEFAGI